MARGIGNGPGQPKILVDWDQVNRMAYIQCTAKEICQVLGISEDTLSRRCKEDHGINTADYLNQKGAGGRMSLRRKQFETAMSGNVTMMIWLGKNILGQKDKIEQNIQSDGKGLEISYIYGGKPITPPVGVPDKQD